MDTLKKARLEAQVSPQQKELLIRAADVAGLSLSDFIKTALLEKANNTLKDHEVLELSLKDQQQLAEHLLNPPEIPCRFQKLIDWRKEQDLNA